MADCQKNNNVCSYDSLCSRYYCSCIHVKQSQIRIQNVRSIKVEKVKV